MTQHDPTLGELGEFAVIDAVAAGRAHPDGVLVGPGDDAAVLATPDGRTVVSTDMLVQDRHFRLDWSTPQQIGRRAIAQNAADIEAMGAMPTGFLVAFGAPAETPARMATELSDGLSEEAAKVGASVVGGDLVTAPQWVVSVTALGDLGGRPAVLRSGTRAGDVVAVSGELGRSAGGYALLAAGATELGPELSALVERHLTPVPPYGQGAVAAAAGATAMTDISDGLITDLAQLAEASGVGIELSTTELAPDTDALVVAAAALSLDPAVVNEWVLGGGEDHALAATFPSHIELPERWRAIGQVVEQPGIRVDGQAWQGPAGWDSYGATR
ncbi:thiamine-phosphate kinase [Mycolicibacterium brumae]|uniref:Thiamine-monophosphate kinase n=1 Tax=Mycolicibacterium brumae TaxID=85968 RepID=A0A2G5P9C7_9MYCO|nr:thiamine-phosphate kinase [Mycolicibacterium brumae]MCV7194632.1 thiamine-phosphate kinase [Mycolicibacterium brumae]PIB74959.1 thiamine-phosphate kinase [Mycolicibacterium brumae]RWA17707.1 hypothetical protein MBRU_18630 [Mycolicibacterium brumae DSM 44177]UWW08063.1 thiamine-phosphate kinase [Mycolicibacterium brumae]